MSRLLTTQVFVSHTSDMALLPAGRSFVQAALDGIARAGMAAVDMRYFAAQDALPADYCRERVGECEAYVAVVGVRYGSLVPGTEVSYTEAEFQEATAAGIPRLVFLLDEEALRPDWAADQDQTAVRSFRQRLREAGLVHAGFGTADGLELEVFHALTEVARVRSLGASRPGIRHALPSDAAAFTGRSAALERITSAAASASSGGGAVVVQAIGGMPGVGKTTLAVHAAHLLREQFPDRQVFVNLHAHTPGQQPVLPADALAGMLVATGVDPRFLPGDLDGRAAMWRDRMARQKALLILDNAASSPQVIPLLPGDPGCLVLVTSRRHLGDLPGAVAPIVLDALPPAEAALMFTRLGPRGAADPAGVAEVVRLAGYLPLAVSLLARVFARHQSWTLADLAAETRGSPLTLKAEDHSIAAAFEVSYRHLDPAWQRFFDLQGLHPGTVTDSYAAAALAGIVPGEAARLLDALHGERLVTEPGHRRYGMHDLLRRYARDHAAASVGASDALERLLDYYQDTAALAQDRLTHQTRLGHPVPATAATAAPAMEDDGQALAWARTERDNLLACIDHVTGTGQHARVIALTASIAELLRRDGPWTEAVSRHAVAVHSARDLEDRHGEANALNDLGIVRRRTGDYQGAARNLKRSLDISLDLGDRHGRARALRNLGEVKLLTGDSLGAVTDFERSLALCRELGDRYGQARALDDLGIVQRLTGDHPAAARDLEEALALFRDLGDRHGQANTLNDFGSLRRLTGDYPAAARDLEEALVLFRELGDRLGQVSVLDDLASVRRLTGDYPAAARDLEEALVLSADLGDRHSQVNTLVNLGRVRQATGDYPAAARDLERAFVLSLDLGDPHGQANALLILGQVRRETGDYPAAAGYFERALASYRHIGDRGGEATALNETGTLQWLSGKSADAEKSHRQALELARVIGGAWDEAHALVGLGRCAAAAGHPVQAQVLLRQAHELFQRIGAAEAPAVLAELSALT